MPNTPTIGKTGNAPIKKQGHTTDGRHGSDPNKGVKGGRSVRDLTAK